MFPDRDEAGGGGRTSAPLVWQPRPGSDSGRPGRGVGSLRPPKSESLLPESHSVIIRLQIVSARIRLAKAVQGHGIEIFIPPHPSAGLFRASWTSGSLGKVGCGVSVVKPSQPLEWDPSQP